MLDRGCQILGRFGAAAMVACAIALIAGPAVSEGYAGVAGGASIPWKGDPGYSILGEVGYNAWGSKYFRAGGEFEFRQHGAALVGTPGTVRLNAYHLRFVGRFIFNPGKLTPYFGGGGGFSLLTTPTTGTTSSQIGMGGGALGLAGVEWPFAKGRVTIFGEGRFGMTWALSGDFSQVNKKGFDGFTGIVGIRSFF